MKNQKNMIFCRWAWVLALSLTIIPITTEAQPFPPSHNINPVMTNMTVNDGRLIVTGPIPTNSIVLPRGHRWRTNYTHRVVIDTEIVAEPIPVPADYYCFTPRGFEAIGRFSTDAEALTHCGTGTQAFVDNHEAVFKRDVTGEFSIVWQFKPELHHRAPLAQRIQAANVVKPKRTPKPPVPIPPSAMLSDTNPPVITAFNVNQAVWTDFPTKVPIIWTQAKGGKWIDPVTGMTVTNIFDVHFPAVSNRFYTAWCASVLGTNWVWYPIPSAYQPATNAGGAAFELAIDGGKRFYQVRSRP